MLARQHAEGGEGSNSCQQEEGEDVRQGEGGHDAQNRMVVRIYLLKMQKDKIKTSACSFASRSSNLLLLLLLQQHTSQETFLSL